MERAGYDAYWRGAELDEAPGEEDGVTVAEHEAWRRGHHRAEMEERRLISDERAEMNARRGA